jgi:hypothetical protein
MAVLQGFISCDRYDESELAYGRHRGVRGDDVLRQQAHESDTGSSELGNRERALLMDC